MLQYPPSFGPLVIAGSSNRRSSGWERDSSRRFVEGTAEVEPSRHAPAWENTIDRSESTPLGPARARSDHDLAWIAYRDQVLGDRIEPVAPMAA
jgi:hypothetical protein